MKVTLGQFLPELGDKGKNAHEMVDIMKQASNDHADIVLFPELALTGYFIQDVKHEMAESIEGPHMTYLMDKCRELKVNAVIPWAELGEEGHVYNSASLISSEGNLLGIYRKVHLYGTEKEVFTAGEQFKVFDTPLGKIGLMICFDLDFPESARSLKLKGADIILTPTNNMEPYQYYQRTYLRARSMENELPIALCNRIGLERHTKFFGESACYDNKGQTITELKNEPNVETAEVEIHDEKDRNLQYITNRMPNVYN
ncbi:carbon-nitrogen hydrolase family protein [Alkalibacillus haloalkaliphilus]|uniref:Apolipoprotein N-acyltransferase n=1 Tax=Alkalibacillus haloalkaliphilus TaxID=94136 RepID=A0A511W4G0_9BACI|nr:carbon-nitrogen hydrolase family protein [Alkalibacillus haloalkaliphilus]GEN45979.1 apolipoprotein N-acyltransferase [Alkalibacillus haloalkaliphilus]